jgi:pimeloyl-ACP methyl ester carboxylesterase
LRAGHPVYFVIFFRDPEPGQTLLDVCTAEQRFVRKVRELHPDSPKPAIIGNCQGGWAAMMLSSSSPEDTGPIVINGAPMSYWGGAWSEGEGDNPMRYSGGLLGGTWLSSLTADMGNGKFDGAWLVYNFEKGNPANTFWDKYYNLYANIDTEPPRFLEFERWWGGYYLMNREEIEWITQNLFVGNKLWGGDVKSAGGDAFDLREIRSPIVLFASMGDNITPPQQAFNWVADLYGSTDEIKARGQVIVGLVHQDIGHLGIFVSGKVAKKEHTQIVSVLQTIERLPPGLYGMEINQRGRATANRNTRSSSASASWSRWPPSSTASSARTRSPSRRSRRFRNSTSAPTSCSRGRWCRRCRTSSRPSCCAASIRCGCSTGRCRT